MYGGLFALWLNPESQNIYKLSVVSILTTGGPRPALYNQDDLIAERDRYGANDVKPGLTGWAQINGRDELEIEVKAKLDGDYTAALNAGRFKGFAMDCRCFFGTIASVLHHDGVVEGGTGAMDKSDAASEDIKGDAVDQQQANVPAENQPAENQQETVR